MCKYKTLFIYFNFLYFMYLFSFLILLKVDFLIQFHYLMSVYICLKKYQLQSSVLPRKPLVMSRKTVYKTISDLCHPLYLFFRDFTVITLQIASPVLRVRIAVHYAVSWPKTTVSMKTTSLLCYWNGRQMSTMLV